LVVGLLTAIRGHRLGIYLAFPYALLISAVIGYTWHNTKPEYVGYDWIPVYSLTMPWSMWLSPLHGAFINTGLLYITGVLISSTIGHFRR
jgi:hypothetical protein